jgi:hypothetical protein
LLNLSSLKLRLKFIMEAEVWLLFYRP